MRLLQRDGSPLSWSHALVLSGSWAVGAAIGMAIGAVLTALSGAGAPGNSAVEPLTDLVVLPLAAGVAVFAAHLGVTVLIARLRAGSAREERPDADEGGEEKDEPKVDG